MHQSKEEILRVFDEWGRHYAPSNFIQNEKNAALLADYIFKTYGIVSITYLNQAVTALASQLDVVPEPKAETLAEKTAKFQQREFLRIQQEQQENSETAFFERAKKAEEERKAANEKLAEKVAAQESYSLIMSYETYAGPGRVDHGKSDGHRKELLRQVERRRKAGVDERIILKEVRDAIQLLP